MAKETRQLGRYELIERIAVGGMGEIYLAKSRGAAGFEKTVIIKKILAHLAEEDEFVTKFLDEGRIVVNLTHGNIVPVFDMDEDQGEYFIAMDYVPGRDLRDVLARLGERHELVPVHLAAFIVTEVCKGLDYAHRRTDEVGNPLNIVHRDVSPSNILISREGEVKIIDFGIARATSRAAKTVSGRIQGKICYMSPEQAGGNAVDPRSDVFSTGVVLYEMLTGQRPFQGDSDLKSLDLVRKCAFETPSEVNPDVPPELDAITSKALARDVSERYQSSDELHVDLLEWLYGGGRAVTSQQLSLFVNKVFPEGFEREELRRARDASSVAETSANMNLDDALNAEFDKLERKPPAPHIDPHTATGLADGPGGLAHGQTSTLDDAASAAAAEAGDPSTPGGDRSAPDQTRVADRDAQETDADRAARNPRDSDLATADRHRQAGGPTGFKRWLAIAVGVGVLVGGAMLYAWVSTEYGHLEVRTDPAGAAIKIDGVKVSGASTPDTVEVESGQRTISVLKRGYESQTFELTVARNETRLLDEGTIKLAAIAADDEPRQAWVTVTPADAAITIDNGERTTTGKARITVNADTQVLVEASHPHCESISKVINYQRAAQPIGLVLECAEPSAASPDASTDASTDEPTVRNPTHKPAQRRLKTIRFATRPPGGAIEVNGEPVDGPMRFRVGQQVALRAALSGYQPVETTLRIARGMGGRYTVGLDKLPTGCLQINHPEGKLFTITVDDRAPIRAHRKRFSLPAGAHEVVLEGPQKRAKSYDVTIDAGANDCTLLGPHWPTEAH